MRQATIQIQTPHLWGESLVLQDQESCLLTMKLSWRVLATTDLFCVLWSLDHDLMIMRKPTYTLKTTVTPADTGISKNEQVIKSHQTAPEVLHLHLALISTLAVNKTLAIAFKLFAINSAPSDKQRQVWPHITAFLQLCSQWIQALVLIFTGDLFKTSFPVHAVQDTSFQYLPL